MIAAVLASVHAFLRDAPSASAHLTKATPSLSAQRHGNSITARLPLPRLAGWLSLAIAALMMAGWAYDVGPVRNALRGVAEIKAGTAAGLTMAIVALLIAARHSLGLAERSIVLLLGLAITSLGLWAIGRDAFGWTVSLEELSFLGMDSTRSASGPPFSNTAISFVAIGLALVALPYALMSPVVWIACVLVALLGAATLLGDPVQSGFASGSPWDVVQAAVALILLGLGTLLVFNQRHSHFDPPALTRSSIEIKVVGGFFGAFAILILGGGVTYLASAEFARSAQLVAQTQVIRNRLSNLYGSVRDAESSERNYLLTGDPRQKADCARSADEARAQAAALPQLVADNPSQVARMATLATVMEQRLQELKLTSLTRDRAGLQAARDMVASGTGEALMNETQALINEMDASEGLRLDAREAKAARDQRNYLMFLLLTMAGTAAMFLMLLRGIRREMLARSQADELVRDLNTELEDRVVERTAALLENQRRFIDLFEFAPAALVMTNKHNRVVQVNRQAEALFGWNRKALVGQAAEVLLPLEARAGFAALRDRYLLAPRPTTMSSGRRGLRGLREDGSTFPAEVSLSPLDAGGELVIVAAVHDITERERMNEAIRTSAALYLHTLDSMLEGCQIFDFELRYVYVNAAALKQNRKTKEALIGRTLTEVTPGIENSEVYAAVVRCMRSRTPQHLEHQFKFPDGEQVWFQVSMLPTLEGISMFSVDIGERKQTEEEVRAAQREMERRVVDRTTEVVHARVAAENANRAKGDFLAAMSHEIRTPMNGIIGMVEVLSHGSLPPDQADSVKTIRDSAFALLNIIDDILDFSKIEAGRLELERAAVILADLAESVCDALLSTAQGKGVDLDLFVAPTLPDVIWSDPTRLRQVLNNLVGNAIKFSGGRENVQGKVSVRVDVDADVPDHLLISVTDNGIGMTEGTLGKLFTSFTQAEASTTRRFGGTGLGLAICKRLAALMHGHVSARSAVGVGSIFTVRLPLEAVDGDARRSRPDLAELHCVVTGECADELAAHLRHAGANVALASTVAQAAHLAQGPAQTVVVHSMGRSLPIPVDLVAMFVSAPEARHVFIARGAGRRSRLALLDGVVLDGDCVRRDSFLNAVEVAAGRKSPRLPADASQNETTIDHTLPLSIADARKQGRLILIAEDDEINQKVILRQIGLLGYAGEVAMDGLEALKLWRAGTYGLLLTDLHMPVMDGYGLARAIRAEEAAQRVRPGARLPILALTANALRGEAVRAEAAGMDEYLTKPLLLHLLRAAIRRWLPSDATDTMPGDLNGPPIAWGTGAIIDVSVLKAVVGDDPAVVTEFLSEYLSSAKVLALELGAVRALDDMRQIGAIAHKLRSSSRAVGALTLGDLCAELENACRIGNREVVTRVLGEFDSALSTVEERINVLLNQR